MEEVTLVHDCDKCFVCKKEMSPSTSMLLENVPMKIAGRQTRGNIFLHQLCLSALCECLQSSHPGVTIQDYEQWETPHVFDIRTYNFSHIKI